MNDMITALLDQLCAVQMNIDGCFLPEMRDHWKEERERIAVELADAWKEQTK